MSGSASTTRLRKPSYVSNDSGLTSSSASWPFARTWTCKASSAADRSKQEYAYARALMLRYLELEDQHEALFPALATALKLTQHEVGRIQAAQQRHASETSLWGRTLWAGKQIAAVAKEVAREAEAARARGSAS